MTRKQVFIIADIGLGNNRAFHVGDEAMFLANLERYNKLGYRVVASSRAVPHSSKNFVELPEITIQNPLLFIGMLIKVFMLKILKINLFSKSAYQTIRALKNSQLLHISGGGNITSFWPGHIYYRSIMIVVAQLYGVPVMMTSQTIGPVTNKFHRLVLRRVLNLVSFIGIRDNIQSPSNMQTLRINSPDLAYMSDDATFLSCKTVYRPDCNAEKALAVGLSLHRWGDSYIDSLTAFVTDLYHRLPNVYFYLIPHHFDDEDGLDIDFMKKITKYVPSSSIHKIPTKHFMDSCDVLDVPSIIKGATLEMDMLISTRYHGLVFGLSGSIPSIAINYDDYYKIKNLGVLSMYFRKCDGYSIDCSYLNTTDSIDLVENVFKNRKDITQHLKKKEEEIVAQKYCFYSGLIRKYML